jgi:hypothetical protein
MSRTNRTADRHLLLGLLNALSVSRANLRRDPCGDWNVVGRRGHVLTDGVNAFVYLPAGTARRWEKAKHVLSFMVATQDGDAEGILRLNGMPTPTQAEALRQVLGLRKASPLTDERRAALISVGFAQAKPPVHDILSLLAERPLLPRPATPKRRLMALKQHRWRHDGIGRQANPHQTNQPQARSSLLNLRASGQGANRGSEMRRRVLGCGR